MRILAVSDIHGSHMALKRLKKESKKADLIFMLGDFTILSNNIKKILTLFNSFRKMVLVITGNHENPGAVKKLCMKFENLYYMNNRIIKINNILIYGYDTNGFSFIDRHFEKNSRKFVDAIEKAEKNSKNNSLKTILLSHASPFGTKADKIMDEHCGNKSVREFILKHKIDYCFSGHIHEGAHTVDKLGNTVVVNPGPYGMIFEIN